jgi:hypothetical protein
MDNTTDDAWWANERIEEQLHRAYSTESPYEHLYEWLKAKDPMLFKQWEAVYDIMRGY